LDSILQIALMFNPGAEHEQEHEHDYDALLGRGENEKTEEAFHESA
jgi:hypothetical protein